MRIAMVTRQVWPAVGGVESVVENLGVALIARGHQVRVVAQAVDELHFGRMTHIVRERLRFQPFTHEGMPVTQFRPSRLRRTLLLPLAAELVPFGGRITRKWAGAYTAGYYARVVRGVLAPLLAGADIVHVLGANFMSVAAVEAAHRLGTPAVISPFAHPGDWGDDAASVRAYLTADGVLSTSAADAAVYAAMGVPPERLHVVGLPVPDALLDGTVPAGEEPPAAGVPLVLYLGQRRPTKRYHMLLDAAEQIWASHPEALIAFVGPGRPLERRDPRILDVGRVSDVARGRWLARATMLCLPSGSESFGMVLAEAWSQRVPVVVSDIPVLRELVGGSGGGVVAGGSEPGAMARAIVSLLDEPARARELGAAGHAYWRAQLTPDAVAARHLEVYERLAGSREPAPSSSS